MKITQKQRVLDYINELCNYGARIDNLMADGYKFKTEWEHKKNRFGEPVSFKRYYLAN